MALQREQIKELVKKPSKKEIINKAILHENRLRFHTLSNLSQWSIGPAFNVYTDWVRSLIPKDKYNIFLSLFRFPTPNIELTKKIYRKLERVFDGRNSAVNFQFSDSTLKDDWNLYRHDVLKEPDIWKSKGWATMKTAINSVIVIDMPAEQTTSRPEPYFYFLGIENVIDYSIKGETLEWIIFKQEDRKIAAFDDTYMRIFALDEKGNVSDMIAETTHGLGFCPARFFWTSAIDEHMPDLKESPLTGLLTDLDWLLFFRISKRHLDLYAPYPIYASYEADCDFKNNATGEYCSGGYLRNAKGEYIMLGDGRVQPCPICAQKRITGVGSMIGIPIPKDGQPDLHDPVKIITVDKNSLDYNTAEVERLENEIYTKAVGTGGEVEQKESINEMQVTANFEDKKDVLLDLKVNFENAMRFVDDTICRLRYGDAYLNCNINLGTEFYLYSVSELQTLYAEAKKNGASEARLDMLADQIIATENRNNPIQMQRMFLLKQLEPYRHLTLSELQGLASKNLIDPLLMLVKINFANFVDRFERENINILEFGNAISLGEKIKIIKQKLIEYAEEQQSSIRESTDARSVASTDGE